MTAIALLQTAGSGGTAAFLVNLLPIAVIGLVVYFLVIARKNKEGRKSQEMLSARQSDRADAEPTWSNKSDDECAEAAKHLSEYTEEAASVIRAELRRRSMPEPGPVTRHTEESEPSEASTDRSQSERINRRYRDAYLVAKTVVAVGKGIKALGMLIGLAVVFAGYMAAESFGVPARVAFGAAGILAGTVIYVFGVLIASQGQLQYAVLDVAVNSSPLLSAERKRDLVLG
jgi:hypothetical protein